VWGLLQEKVYKIRITDLNKLKLTGTEWANWIISLLHLKRFLKFKRLLKTHLFGVWDRGALWRLS